MQPLKNATKAGVPLSLGLVGLNVSLHAAVGENDTEALHNVCVGGIKSGHEPTQVRQKMICPHCGNDDKLTFAKASDQGGTLVVIPEEVIEERAAAGAGFKSLQLTVHPTEEVTSVLLPNGKAYYVALKNPTEDQRRTYTTLARVIQERQDVALMTKFSFRTAINVFRLNVVGEGTLVLQQMADADLIRQHPVIEFVEPTGKALQLANTVLDLEVQPFVGIEHGSGKTEIISTYAEAMAPIPVRIPEPTALTPQSSGEGTVTDLLAAMVASKKAPTKAGAKAKAAKNAGRKAS